MTKSPKIQFQMITATYFKEYNAMYMCQGYIQDFWKGILATPKAEVYRGTPPATLTCCFNNSNCYINIAVPSSAQNYLVHGNRALYRDA